MKTHSNVSLEALEPRLAPAGIIALDVANQLHLFDSATPGTVIIRGITGLSAPTTEIIKGIDYRPATGQLYALGINVVPGGGNDEGRIYTIDPATGVATQVGSGAFYSTFSDGADFAFDFNPLSDRIRITTDFDDHMRVNPNDAALLTDTDINPASSSIVGVAYTNNFDGATSTTLYGIDNNTDSLVTINPPNNGTVNAVGALGIAFTSFKAGFDIESRTGVAYAVLTPTGGSTGLYTINLVTGAATLVGLVGGNPSLQGMTVAVPDGLTIVDANTATYTDIDGDKVTVKITGAPAGAALSRADFGFSIGLTGSQLRFINLSDDGQEWAKANITITAVPVGSNGDSFATVGYINATGVDLGKVTIDGDLGQIDAGKVTGDKIPGLASLTVQTFGVFGNSQPSTASNISNIVGQIGSLTVKADMANAVVSTSGADGSLGSLFIGGNLDGRTSVGSGSGTARFIINDSIGNIVINGSVFGGGIADSARIAGATGVGNLTIGGSLFGGTGMNSAYITGNTIGNILIKGSIVGGADANTGRIVSSGNIGSVTVKGSIMGGTVVNAVNDTGSGNIYASANMGAVVIGGNLIGSNGYYSGNVYSVGTIKSVSIGGYIQGGSGFNGGTVQSGGNMGNVSVLGDVFGGTGDFSGSLLTFDGGSIASVTIGGSLFGAGEDRSGILSDNQIGTVKITGEMINSRISAIGGSGSPAAMVAIKGVSVGLGVEDSVILAGYNTMADAVATNANATLGPVTIGGNFVTSNIKAGAMAAVIIKGNLDGRGMAAANGVFSLGAIASVNIGGNLFGGSAVDAGQVESLGAMGAVTIGGSIFGGTASYAGNIESGTTMGNVLVKGSVFGGTDDHTGNIHSRGNMGSVTIKGSIVGGIVVDAGTDLDSGLVYAVGIDGASMGAVVIGGNLIGTNSDYSGGLYANGTIKSVVVNGFMQGGSGGYSGSITSGDGLGNITIAGDLKGGSGDRSGSIVTFDNGNIANVTIGGSLYGGFSPLTGILSNNQLGAVKINLHMEGGRISAEGVVDPATAALATAIKSVSITGTMINGRILGGYNHIGDSNNPDAAIGAVTIGGNFISSSIIAGVEDGADNYFGNNDDAKISEAMADTRFSSIASVTIKGFATGTNGGLDHYGIVAEQIGAVKVGLRSFVLAPGTDTTGLLIGSTGDFRVREIAP